MSDRTFLQVQATQLRELLRRAQNDPVLAPQLKQRLEAAEEELRQVEQTEGRLFPSRAADLPRVALFLKGAGVEGSEGIRPALAGEALIQYEKMFVEQALHDERAAARAAGRQRRRRGAPTPALLFTGTPRGSFGLEFVPQQTAEEELLNVHAQSLKNVADALVRVTSSDRSLEDAIRGLAPRILSPLKRFLHVLSQNEAELRLAFSDAPPKTVSAESVRTAAQRMERELVEEAVTETGVFRGLTRETAYFDFVTDDSRLITGTLADGLTEDDFDRINALTNQHCVAELEKTTLRDVAGERETYVLLDARPVE